jgi:hypothetical protein
MKADILNGFSRIHWKIGGEVKDNAEHKATTEDGNAEWKSRRVRLTLIKDNNDDNEAHDKEELLHSNLDTRLCPVWDFVLQFYENLVFL